jgi:hypothetical protein
VKHERRSIKGDGEDTARTDLGGENRYQGVEKHSTGGYVAGEGATRTQHRISASEADEEDV